MPGIALGVPPIISQLIQSQALERAFHDGLYPNLAYRSEAAPEEWEANTGQQRYMTRPGLLAPIVTPIPVGSDPVGQTIPMEQWVATLQQFAGKIDTHMPTSVVAMANLLLRNVKQLGLQAGQSVNRIARNSLFQAYLQAQSVNIAAIGSGDTTIRVAALNGFTTVVIPGSQQAPVPVSSAYPMPITITGATTVSAQVIGYQPDDPTNPLGPGSLTLAAAVGTAFPLRSTVATAYAPTVVRSAPGGSIDSIGASDAITLQQIIAAVAVLRQNNVQPHDDGYFHCHISPVAMAQLFADPVFQRLNQSLPSHVIYQQGFLGHMAGVLFFLNTESPGYYNSGSLIATANDGLYATELGAELVNGSGVQIGRALLTGQGAVYEKYLDESAFVTQAGTTGKIGEFAVTNNGIQIMTERIRLILRAPLDVLQQVVTAAWSISTSFPIPTDITAPTGPQIVKRAIVCEYAGS